MKQLTGAQELLLAASSAGVDVCFANPGTSEMWFVSALDAVPSIRPVLGLHETVCSGACDGYARIARKPALSLLHLGPGLANAVANLHNARRARSPVLALIGDQASWHAAADPLLCMDIEALAGTVSGSVIRVSDPAEMVPAVRRALEACRSGGAGGAGNSASTPDSAAVITAADEGVYTARSYNPASPRDVVPISRQSLAPGSRVATIIVPHDFSWEALPASSGSAAAPAAAAAEAAEDPDALLPALNGGSRSSPAPRARRDAADSDRRRYYRTGDVFADGLLRRSGGARRFIKDLAAALRSCPSGKAALYLGGEALLADGGALPNAGRVAAATGAALLCENAFARLDRGTGMPHPTRVPYFPQEAAQALSVYELLVVVDAKVPVANFGYRGGPSRLVGLPDSAVWCIDASRGVPDALSMLAEELGAAAGSSSNSGNVITPGVNCRGLFSTAVRRPPLLPPHTRLTGPALCAVVAALQPEGAIIVDESLTSGGSYWDASRHCPPFTHLTLTGGAIGSGPPMAVGAAVAAQQLAAAAQWREEEEKEAKTEVEGMWQLSNSSLMTSPRLTDGAAATGPAAPSAAPQAQHHAGGSGSGGDSGGDGHRHRRRRRRVVINLQADGSAMYSLQALWTQAREKLDVVTIICANEAYAILKVECMRQATPRAGAATRALTELGQPSLDWVSLAAGMGVPGRRCATVGELEEALRAVLPAGSGDSSSAAAAAAGAAAAAPATAAGAGGARGTINTAAAAPPHTGPFLIHAMLS